MTDPCPACEALRDDARSFRVHLTTQRRAGIPQGPVDRSPRRTPARPRTNPRRLLTLLEVRAKRASKGASAVDRPQGPGPDCCSATGRPFRAPQRLAPRLGGRKQFVFVADARSSLLKERKWGSSWSLRRAPRARLEGLLKERGGERAPVRLSGVEGGVREWVWWASGPPSTREAP